MKSLFSIRILCVEMPFDIGEVPLYTYRSPIIIRRGVPVLIFVYVVRTARMYQWKILIGEYVSITFGKIFTYVAINVAMTKRFSS